MSRRGSAGGRRGRGSLCMSACGGRGDVTFRRADVRRGPPKAGILCRLVSRLFAKRDSKEAARGSSSFLTGLSTVDLLQPFNYKIALFKTRAELLFGISKALTQSFPDPDCINLTQCARRVDCLKSCSLWAF